MLLLLEGRWLRTFAREEVRALYVGVRVLAPVVVLSGLGGGRRREDVFAKFVVFERLRLMGVGGGGCCRLALGVSSSESSSSSSSTSSSSSSLPPSPSEESSSSDEDSLASSSSDELSSYCCTTGVLRLLILGALEEVACVGCMMS